MELMSDTDTLILKNVFTALLNKQIFHYDSYQCVYTKLSWYSQSLLDEICGELHVD